MSPWLYQLIHKRPIDTLHSDIKTDIAVLGAGIAGVMTAYFLLKETDKQVVLIDAGKVAHGATGHNAGQLVGEFERELHDIAEEFGVEKAVHAEKLVNSAWIMIEEIVSEARLTTPYSTFLGYNGYQSIGRVIDELKNNALRQEAGEPIHQIFIAEDALGLSEIPAMYTGLYNVIPRRDILNLLETEDVGYVAAMSLRKGCINGAMLCEEIVGYLIAQYSGRFLLAEHAPIAEVILGEGTVELKGDEYTVQAEKVVLCTNGFSKFKITNTIGVDIDTLFHHQIHGFMGYMAGYFAELDQQPNALAYYSERSKKGKHHVHNKGDYYDDPYFYLTRRPYEVEKNEIHNLVCIGGPEVYLHDTSVYDPHGAYDKKMADEMDAFLKKTYRHVPQENLQFKFTWHGLMGFTPNGIRMIGAEPLNPVLMYNLGCNGVGILASIYGASRIADLVNEKDVSPTIFDPKRCGDKAC
ncbi:MAG: hypothetical protein RIQ72_80 [Candidatus Parcubacteria bacterium]